MKKKKYTKRTLTKVLCKNKKCQYNADGVCHNVDPVLDQYGRCDCFISKKECQTVYCGSTSCKHLIKDDLDSSVNERCGLKKIQFGINPITGNTVCVSYEER